MQAPPHSRDSGRCCEGIEAVPGCVLPLDAMLVSYQRGAVLLQFCRDKLQAVEDQVKVLEDGVLKPWKTS